MRTHTYTHTKRKEETERHTKRGLQSTLDSYPWLPPVVWEDNSCTGTRLESRHWHSLNNESTNLTWLLPHFLCMLLACDYANIYISPSHGYVYKYIQAHHCPTKVRVKNDSITVKDLTPGHIFRLPILCLGQAPKQVCLSCLALPSKEGWGLGI